MGIHDDLGFQFILRSSSGCGTLHLATMGDPVWELPQVLAPPALILHMKQRCFLKNSPFKQSTCLVFIYFIYYSLYSSQLSAISC